MVKTLLLVNAPPLKLYVYGAVPVPEVTFILTVPATGALEGLQTNEIRLQSLLKHLLVQ